MKALIHSLQQQVALKLAAAFQAFEQNRFGEAVAGYEAALESLSLLASQQGPNELGFRIVFLGVRSELAASLSGMRRWDEAEAILKDSLREYRSLEKIDLTDHRADIARTLNRLGVLFRDRGRLGEAESHYVEALEYYRILEKVDPSTHLPAISAVLNNLGVIVRDRGRLIESEGFYLEALYIRRGLAEVDSLTYRPAVAMTLNNLGLLFVDFGRLGEAERLCLEALEIYRRLEKSDRSAHRPSVAATLSNLANLLRERGRLGEAEVHATEALQIRQELAEHDPATYRALYARTLNSLAVLVSARGRLIEAEGLLFKALETFRSLADLDSLAYLPELAATLNNLAGTVADLGRLEESKGFYLEALSVSRSLAESDSTAFGPLVAMALINLVDVEFSCGSPGAANHYYSEALEIYERLAAAEPEAWGPDLAVARLRQRGGDLAQAGLQESVTNHTLVRYLGALHLRWVESGSSAEVIQLQLIENDILAREGWAEAVEPDRRIETALVQRGDHLAWPMGRGDRVAFDASLRAKGVRLGDAIAMRSVVASLTEKARAEYQEFVSLQNLDTGRIIDPADRSRADARKVELNTEWRPIVRAARESVGWTEAKLWASLQRLAVHLLDIHLTDRGTVLRLRLPDGELRTEILEELKLAVVQDWFQSDEGFMTQLYTYKALAGQEIGKDPSVLKRAQHKVEVALERARQNMGVAIMPSLRQLLDGVAPGSKLLVLASKYFHNIDVSTVPDADGRTLLDDYDVAFTPSIAAYLQEKPVSNDWRSGAVVDPTALKGEKPILGSGLEASYVDDRFPPPSLAFHETPDSLRAAPDAELVWFSCHGSYDMNSPLESHVQINFVNGENVKVRAVELLGAASPFPAARLAVLSACSTGEVSIGNLNEESMSVGAAFLAAGIPMVWSALWPVGDIPTYLLMTRAAQNLYEGQSPSLSLRAAKHWLRDATAAELLAHHKAVQAASKSGLQFFIDSGHSAVAQHAKEISLDLSRMSGKPFAHAYHWAGFQHLGKHDVRQESGGG